VTKSGKQQSGPFADQSIREAGIKLRSREVSAAELTRHYLDRIAQLDGAGELPINSVMERNPDAAKFAAQLDREARRGKWRGPLHGIPILLKDNIDTGDRMQTTAGSIALLGSRAKHDAFVVSQLRAAGAVIIGKTNLSEWANFRGERSTSGWSSRGGLTRNPHDRARTASGSSSGSGAAIAADFAIAAIGTETDGSITSPANACGIVGLKPTLGLVSRHGIIPIAHSQDTAGPMSRTVEDAALVLAAMRGVDRQDTATRASKPYTDTEYPLNPDALRGARIGVARCLAGTQSKVLVQFERALMILKESGALLIDELPLKKCLEVGETEITVLHYEFRADLNRYLRERDHPTIRSVADAIEFNRTHANQVLQHFGQEHMIAAAACKSLRTEAYSNALAKNHLFTRAVIARVLRRFRLDAIVVPTGAPAHLVDLINGDADSSDVYSTSPAAVAGYPHITVPSGFVVHLPVGLSFFAEAWSEPRLLNLAYAYEQATLARRPPKF
jgi:amidase